MTHVVGVDIRALGGGEPKNTSKVLAPKAKSINVKGIGGALDYEAQLLKTHILAFSAFFFWKHASIPTSLKLRIYEATSLSYDYVRPPTHVAYSTTQAKTGRLAGPYLEKSSSH